MRYYLDRETGAVLMVTDEARHMLEEVYEEIEGDASLDQIKECLTGRDAVPDWQIDAALEAYRVEEGYGDTVIEVPQLETREAWQDMADFVESVPNFASRDRPRGGH